MGLYLDNGFVNFDWVKRQNLPFNLLIGGRGIGKTFGCLENLLLGGDKFIFARRTERQLQNIAKPDSDPTIDINAKNNTAFSMRTVPGIGMGIFAGERNAETGEIEPFDRPVAICQAVSTVGNLRGAGGGVEYKYLVYDEFIKLNHEKPFKGEDSAFMDLYETLNRNRELPPPMGQGLPPLQAFLLSNSNRIDSPVIAAFGLINQLAKMQVRASTTGEDQIYINRDRGILVVYFADSEVSRAKRNTALYKALGNSSYTDMAISNKFVDDVGTPDIRSCPIVEYRPIIAVGEITIYEHKNGSHYYVNSRRTHAPVMFGNGSSELEKFSRRYGKIYSAYLSDAVFFEDFGTKTAFVHYFSY